LYLSAEEIVYMSGRTRIILILIGLALLTFAVSALFYVYLPVDDRQIVATLQPTLLAPPP
jgi:hypothetical protein